MARKPADFVQFKLRIREDLRRRLEREAEKKKISTNAEAVERLEKSFDVEKTQKLDQTLDAINAQLPAVAAQMQEFARAERAIRTLLGEHSDLVQKSLLALQRNPALAEKIKKL